MMDGMQAKERWLVPLLALFAALLVWLHTPSGIAVSTDSLSYLSTARNILAGHGIVYGTYALDGPATAPTTLWPPLYAIFLSAVISAADMLGRPVEWVLPWVNAALLFVAMWLFAGILRRSLGAGAAVLVCMLFALLPSLQIVYMYVWSETLFIPLSLLAYALIGRHLAAPRGGGGLLMAAVLVLVAATYTRYVGLAYFAAAMAAVMLLGPDSWTGRIRRLLLSCLVYGLGLLPLFARNLLYSGHISGGERGQPAVHPVDDLATLGGYLYAELFNLPGVVAAIGVGLFLLFLVSVWYRSRPAPDADVDTWRVLWLPLLFAGSYLAFLLVSRTSQQIDLDTRMLSVLMPFVLLSLVGLYRLLGSRIGARAAALPFALALSASVANAAAVHGHIIENWRKLDAPGRLLGIEYPTLSHHRFDILRGIAGHFQLAPGDLLLTDARRPSVVAAFFPNAEVRRLPPLSLADGGAVPEKLLARRGIVLLTTSQGAQVWPALLGEGVRVHRVRVGHAGMLVVRLPLVEGGG